MKHNRLTRTIAKEECEVNQGIWVGKALLSGQLLRLGYQDKLFTVIRVSRAHKLVASPVLNVKTTSLRMIVSDRSNPVRDRNRRMMRITAVDMSLTADRILTDLETHSRSLRPEKESRDVLK